MPSALATNSQQSAVSSMPPPAATTLSKTGAEMQASAGASAGSVTYNGDDAHRSAADYEAAMQQRQFYQLTQPNAGHQHYDVLASATQQATTTSLVTTAASGAVAHTTLIETSLATFNGNSHYSAAKGGGTPPYGIPSGNGNNHSHSNSNSSSTNNVNNNIGGNNTKASPSPAGSGGDAIALVSALKKSALPPPPPMHANSREDVASLGGTSSVYSQQSTSTNNAAPPPPNAISNNDTGSLPQYNAGYGNASNGPTGLGGPFMANEKNENNNNPGIPFGNAPPAVESSYCSRENEDPGDGLGPLPPKWETAYTERGELYFIDHNTGTSHWLDPRLSKFQKKSLEDCGDDELPYGWEKIEDSLYGTYFIDHVNRRTQYENPVLEAKRRAAEQKQEQQQLQQQHQNHNAGQMPRSQSTSGHLNEDGDHDGERNGLDNDSLMGNGGRPGGSAMNPLPPPPALNYGVPPSMGGVPLLPYKFTRNPAEMQGERITTTLVKSARGLGITIVGGDDSAEEFLQIKSVVPNGPAWLDGRLRTGDILVYINDTCVLGFTHHEMVNIFQSILPGDSVTLEVCRGYPLPFDPNDPNTEVVTTIAVDGMTMSSLDPGKSRRYDLGLNMDGNYNYAELSSEAGGAGATGGPMNGALSGGGGGDITNSEFILKKKMDVATHTVAINKGTMGFGFTISDSVDGQTVKKIIDRNCCPQLQEDDVLLEINGVDVKNKTHQEVVQLLKECSNTEPTLVKIQRGVAAPSGGGLMQSGSGNVAKLRKNFITGKGLFRSKTPTADLYSTQQKEVLPIRPKTPLVDTRRARVKTPDNELNQECDGAMGQGSTNGPADNMGHNLGESRTDNKSTNSLLEIEAINKEIPYMDPYPKMMSSLSERLAGASLMGSDPMGGAGRKYESYQQQEYATAGQHNNYLSPADCNPIYGLTHNPDLGQHLPSVGNGSGRMFAGVPALSLMNPSQPQQHHENCQCYECQDYQANKFRQQQQTLMYGMAPQGSSGSPLMPMGGMSGQYSPAGGSGMGGMHLGPNERSEKRINELLNDRRRVGFTPLDSHSLYNLGGPGAYKPQMLPHQMGQQQQQQQQLSFQPNHSHINWAGVPQNGGILRNGHMDLMPSDEAASDQYELTEVTLERQALGFGFRIVGGTEEGSQVTVGHIVPGGAADNDHRITTGDEILSIDGINVVHASHHKVVSLMGEAALRGQVTMILRRRVNGPGGGGGGGGSQLTPQMPQSILRSPAVRYPYDVIVSRHENEGFGFVIISSSNQYYGSTIGKLIPGSPADRCNELKVGDRITAVNRIDIAGMSHGDVVNLIKDSGLHVRLTIGCPKEGAAMGGPHLNNSKQISPGQLSQIPSMGYHTPLLQQQQQQQSPQPLAGTPTLQPPQQL